MRSKYLNYLKNDYKFDKATFMGILCLIVVILEVFGFLYEVFF